MLKLQFLLKLAKKVGDINENEKIILDIILKNPKITIAEMSIKSNKSIRTINRILTSLKEKNLLKRMNSNKMDIGRF